jgi:MHS family proline/betaine transporter-like MFS transporter
MSTDKVLSPEQRSKFRRILASALVGNMLEFYDLFVYGFLAVVIARAFFPTGDAYTSMLAAAAAFGVSYFIRPLGAMVIGAYSDRQGRKAGMMLIFWWERWDIHRQIRRPAGSASLRRPRARSASEGWIAWLWRN